MYGTLTGLSHVHHPGPVRVSSQDAGARAAAGIAAVAARAAGGPQPQPQATAAHQRITRGCGSVAQDGRELMSRVQRVQTPAVSGSLPRQIQIGQRALDCLGRPRNRLGERGMRMNREPDVGGVANRPPPRVRPLADQLAGVGADDAATQHAVRVRIEQQLGETLLAAERE